MRYLPTFFAIVVLCIMIANTKVTVNGEPLSDVLCEEIMSEPDYETPECFGDDCYRDTSTADESNEIFFPSSGM